MSQSITVQEWSLRRSAFEGRAEELRMSQNRVFRVFQALAKQDTALADKYVADGAALDMPLILDETQAEAVPNAGIWRPVGGEGLSAITLLGWAAANGDKDAIVWLLRRGAEPAQTFSGNRDAAWLAMEQGNDEIHKLLMERGCAPGLRIKDAHNTTRLMAAVDGSHVGPVKHILARKANVNAIDARGRTALHYNLSKDPYSDDDTEIGRMLLDVGANPNVEDLDGIPPHVLNQSPAAVSLLQGQALQQASADAIAALEKQRQVQEPEPLDIEPPPNVIVPKMPRQGPRRL
jgi:hypothetical protein